MLFRLFINLTVHEPEPESRCEHLYSQGTQGLNDVGITKKATNADGNVNGFSSNKPIIRR